MQRRLLLVLSVWFVLMAACTAPQHFWPQRDIAIDEINSDSLDKKLLIASRESEFKAAIISRVKEAYAGRDIYIRLVGIEDLKKEDPQQYTAILIVNTCMGWDIDWRVKDFLNRCSDLNSVVVLTTADGEDIYPQLEGRQVDAMSSASTSAKIDPLAEQIIAKLHRLL
ncbi:MAG: hypothetical protein AMJ54_08155 [Deltaproteobacteria bacterium SG8_13]|nr:MAG: hypothetical protein AMJ54_08155 [Deltaproteobacteria bacterium SG8_13]